MKVMVLNFNDSLVARNEHASRTTTMLSSLTSTSRRHDIDLRRYFTQLLIDFPTMALSQFDHRLPDI